MSILKDLQRFSYQVQQWSAFSNKSEMVTLSKLDKLVNFQRKIERFKLLSLAM